jgi:hypothetical protein
LRTAWAETQTASLTPIAFWLKRINHFRLLDFTIFIADLDIFTILIVNVHLPPSSAGEKKGGGLKTHCL